MGVHFLPPHPVRLFSETRYMYLYIFPYIGVGRARYSRVLLCSIFQVFGHIFIKEKPSMRQVARDIHRMSRYWQVWGIFYREALGIINLVKLGMIRRKIGRS